MNEIRTAAPARAGLLGNPSDGYYGRTLAVAVQNFQAEAFLHESQKMVIHPPAEDEPLYDHPAHFLEEVTTYGYYGGLRLIKAALKVFFDYYYRQHKSLPRKNFSLEYRTTIPRQVGLGGSSAIITAVMKALQQFYELEIPREYLPTLILAAEREELGINAGFMDRVVQVYEGCVYMELEAELIKQRGYGRYESQDPDLLPPLYLAYRPTLGKISGRVLNDIRLGYERGDPLVVSTLREIASLAKEGKEALLARDWTKLAELMNKNFDLRAKIMKISPANMTLIQTARQVGVPAKFAGSGGSIIGFYTEEGTFNRLQKELAAVGAKVIKVKVF